MSARLHVQNGYMARKIVLASNHWKRTRETQDTSVQNILMVVHKRTYVLVLFSLASKHSTLQLRDVVRSCLQSWEPQLKIASSCQSVCGLHLFFAAIATEGCSDVNEPQGKLFFREVT